MITAQICKKWISPKYGDNGVHVFIFILALSFTVVQTAANHNPAFMTILEQAGLLLVATVGTYHVLFKKIGDVLSLSVLGSE